MDRFLSVKLKAISFFSMIMVVFIHANNIEVSKGRNTFIQNFISDGISRVAVPIFFVVASYLYFLNLDGTLRSFGLKFKKRLKTLLIPYVLWSSWGVLVFFLLQSIPVSHSFFNSKPLSDYSLQQLVIAVLVHPLTYQLWFVRDLMVLVLLSPLIYVMIRQFQVFPLFVFLVIWYFGYPLMIVTSEAVFFFSLGAYAAICKPVFPLSKMVKTSLTATGIWIMMVVYKTAVEQSGTGGMFTLNFIRKAGILIGVFSIWFGYDRLFKGKDISECKWYGLLSFSFFLYAFHEPVLTIVEKLLFYILCENSFNSLMIYFMVPLIVIPFSLLAGYFLKRRTPKFYQLITGGR